MYVISGSSEVLITREKFKLWMCSQWRTDYWAEGVCIKFQQSSFDWSYLSNSLPPPFPMIFFMSITASKHAHKATFRWNEWGKKQFVEEKQSKRNATSLSIIYFIAFTIIVVPNFYFNVLDSDLWVRNGSLEQSNYFGNSILQLVCISHRDSFYR